MNKYSVSVSVTLSFSPIFSPILSFHTASKNTSFHRAVSADRSKSSLVFVEDQWRPMDTLTNVLYFHPFLLEWTTSFIESKTRLTTKRFLDYSKSFFVLAEDQRGPMEVLINLLHFSPLSVKSFTLQGNPAIHLCIVVLNFSFVIVLQKEL